jgi:hypothetical protein
MATAEPTRAGARCQAFGNTEPVRYQRIYAHELTHNFGLGHTSGTIDQVGWDVGARLTVRKERRGRDPGRTGPLPKEGPVRVCTNIEHGATKEQSN